MNNELDFDVQQEPQQLKPSFFVDLIKAQVKYATNRDQQSMKDLLCYYTDCVNYFQIKQEPISQYFKIKIKDIVKQIKLFGTHELAQQNKQKMNKDVIRVMQEQNIQQKISATLKNQQKMNQTVNKIIASQNQKLISRLEKKRKRFGKSYSVTMSFGSMDSNIDILTPIKQIKQRKPLFATQKFIFTKQIGSSDEQNSTS